MTYFHFLEDQARIANTALLDIVNAAKDIQRLSHAVTQGLKQMGMGTSAIDLNSLALLSEASEGVEERAMMITAAADTVGQ